VRRRFPWQGQITKPENPRPRIAHMRHIEYYGEKAQARHFVIAWVPGYSKDGNTALFTASFGPITSAYVMISISRLGSSPHCKVSRLLQAYQTRPRRNSLNSDRCFAVTYGDGMDA
jgi:hypothetical protein